MGEPEEEQLEIRDGIVKGRLLPRPKLDTVSCDINIRGVAVKGDKSILPTVSPSVMRSFSYLIGKSEDGFVPLRCTPEGYLIVKNTGVRHTRFGDSTGVDDFVKGPMWKMHTFADVYNYLHIYVFGVYLEVEISMDGKVWGNRRITIADGSASPHVSILELYADFRYVRVRIARDGKLASYSINVSKTE